MSIRSRIQFLKDDMPLGDRDLGDTSRQWLRDSSQTSRDTVSTIAAGFQAVSAVITIEGVQKASTLYDELGFTYSGLHRYGFEGRAFVMAGSGALMSSFVLAASTAIHYAVVNATDGQTVPKDPLTKPSGGVSALTFKWPK